MNQIGDPGLTSLAEACAKGALASLKELRLNINQIGDAGLASLADACAKGALAQLTVRSLPTAFTPAHETWHVSSADARYLFGVRYTDAVPLRQQDR